jgi:hypothetical protein
MKTRCECLEIIKVLVNKCMHEYRAKFHREKNNNHLGKLKAVQAEHITYVKAVYFAT